MLIKLIEHSKRISNFKKLKIENFLSTRILFLVYMLESINPIKYTSNLDEDLFPKKA